MKFYGALVLMLTLSAACGLRCYTCKDVSCTQPIDCVAPLNRCSSTMTNDVVTKGCINSDACRGPIQCCNTDLCNSAIPTGSSFLLLLVSSAITAAFL